MTQLLINGRFLGRPATGVDRVGLELTRALMRRGLGDLRIVVPGRRVAEAVPDDLRHRLCVLPCPGDARVWEQSVLAAYRPGAWLFSPCNMGPLLRRRHVLMLHDLQTLTCPDSYTPAFRLWYRAALPVLARRAARVVTVSDATRAALSHAGLVPDDAVEVISNGADHILRAPAEPAALARFGLRAGGYHLAVGSIAAHKNLGLLSKLARDRGPDAVPIVLAGGGQDARVHADDRADGLLRIGRVSDGQLRALYDGAVSLLFPSRAEGFGLPLAEAMACGCPVIASDRGALPEVSGGAAWHLGPDDPGAWRAAMERLEQDAPLRARLRDAGLRRAKALTWDRAAARLAALWVGLTAGSQDGRKAHRNSMQQT